MDSLAKEVAFALSTNFSHRLIYDRYMVAYNATLLKDWEHIAVVQKGYSLKRFDQLVCVKLKDLESKEFKDNNPIFINVLLNELTILGRII